MVASLTFKISEIPINVFRTSTSALQCFYFNQFIWSLVIWMELWQQHWEAKDAIEVQKTVQSAGQGKQQGISSHPSVLHLQFPGWHFNLDTSLSSQTQDVQGWTSYLLPQISNLGTLFHSHWQFYWSLCGRGSRTSSLFFLQSSPWPCLSLLSRFHITLRSNPVIVNHCTMAH